MKKNLQKGIAIFIAVIAVSALLLIAYSISDIAYKQQLISYSGRDSKVAFYAADAGVECALFYDLQGGPGAAHDFAFAILPGENTDGDELECIGEETYAFTSATSIDGASGRMTTFYFNVSDSPDACAIVRVSKAQDGGTVRTVIDSRGYNAACDNSTPQLNPSWVENDRNLERSFLVTYP